jgi:hypothetical protein
LIDEGGFLFGVAGKSGEVDYGNGHGAKV